MAQSDDGSRTARLVKVPESIVVGDDSEIGRAFRLADVRDKLIRGSKGEIKPCEFNAEELMSKYAALDSLHFDDFLGRIRIDGRDWSDHDDRLNLRWLQSAHNVSGFTLSQARTAAATLAYARRRDSLMEFVRDLPSWDGEPRIAMAFTDAWEAPDCPLTRKQSENLFIALHARAVNPGAQVDHLWVVEGAQGSGKSRGFRALGGPFHAEISAPVGSLDFQREMCGIWIAEFAELDALKRGEASTIKRLLSCPVDRRVEKYERHAQSYPRRAVAVASTNETNYWFDATGARRLQPIRAGAINVDFIENNRLLWFAEARSKYEAGATWWEFPSSAAADQDDRQVVDPWEDHLKEAMNNGRRTGVGRVQWPTGWIASSEIMVDWLKLDPQHQGQSSSTRLGRVMRRLGYVPQRSGKSRERGWIADTCGTQTTQESA